LRKESTAQIPAGAGGPPRGVAAGLAPLFLSLFDGPPPLSFVFWDGSQIGEPSQVGRVVVRNKDALRRLLWAPGELGLARAFVAGDIDFEGEIYAILQALNKGVANRMPRGRETLAPLLRVLVRLRLFSFPPAPPHIETRPSRLTWGSRHSRRRDAVSVQHHYDVGNDFYALVLGPSMTYSCGRFLEPSSTLEEAQAAKHELICRKLGLHQRPGARLLDVGCGWGSMAIHAAANHKAEVVGITLSPAQVELARQRVEAAGLTGRVEIRLQDYRELRGETFDAISSIGMFEHVGSARMGEYFSTLYGLLGPEGRLLNHAISKVGGSKMKGRQFINRYVFPDGELIDVAEVIGAMERAGFEVRDLESLREHYARTLRCWVANLEAQFDRAASLTSSARARVWRLYMAASANGFEDNGMAIHQVLGVKTALEGNSGMPPTRRDWG
jgi:cyclopropane-fatty-acyl-phospholipid synthase